MDIKDIVDKINDLPPLPITVLKLMELTSNTDSSAKEIMKVIEMDTSLTAKILQIANSAYYGLKIPVTSLQKAITVLGNRAIYEAAISSYMSNYLSREVKGYAIERGLLWQHSITSAIISKIVKQKIGSRVPADELFTCALLQNIGKIILDEYMGEKMKDVIDLIEKEKMDFTVAEETVLGYNHAQVGYELLKRWKLPDKICLPVYYHHIPKAAPEEYREMALIVNISDTITMMMGVGPGVDGLSYVVDSTIMKELGISSKIVQAIMIESWDQFEKIKSLYNI